LSGRVGNEGIEVRLAADSPRGFKAVLFGAGDWRTRTEDRPPPPRLEVGARIDFDGLSATITEVDRDSPRLVELAFDREGDGLWAAIYRIGRPIQYAYHQRPLDLWSVQTAYGAAPVAFEMPSAGRALSGEVLLALRRRGVGLATLTHAAGLSATGDVELDRRLPLPERYSIPSSTIAAVDKARAEGRRVLAVGTTVVRALESAALSGVASGVTDLKIGPGHRLRAVTDLLTGMHVPAESHYELLHAFTGPSQLAAATAKAAALGYLSHEFGDQTLILGGAALARAA
jgi:S-adenosylmethionine:tRNA ribosyltransferase-isomerase